MSINVDKLGIKTRIMDLIFQPYYTTNPGVNGTGLGFSVSYGAVHNHQGKVESEHVQGTILTVLLPIIKRVSVDHRKIYFGEEGNDSTISLISRRR